jgi:hypothetical protein
MSPRGIFGVVGIAIAKLRHDRARTVLAVVGVTLAVLATVLLVGTGIGVVETGQEQFDRADRDLWITGGPVQFAPTQPGGVRNSVFDAHQFADDLNAREGVRTASPLLFQTLYVSRDGEEFQNLAAMGVRGAGGVSVSEGRGFENDDHYTGGSYDGPRTEEMLSTVELQHYSMVRSVTPSTAVARLRVLARHSTRSLACQVPAVSFSGHRRSRSH